MRTYDIIYLDLDGVFADFLTTFDKIVGHPYDQDPVAAWAKLDQVDHLFLNLEPFPYARELFDQLCNTGVETKILTALPKLTGKLHTAEQDKREWVAKHLSSDIEVICTDGWRGKSAYANRRSILIDDSIRNIEDWFDHGGMGIWHTGRDYKSSLDTVAALNLTLKTGCL